jgi:DNA-binding transcriptional LysR family regulator
VDLRQLRCFIAVAEEAHVTRAAERLGIQQPSLSRLINRVERELDVQLFRRRSRGLALTEAGTAFLQKARAAISTVEQAIVTAKRTARGEQGRIRVGVSPTASFHPFVPPLIREFRDALPLVSIILEEDTSDILVERLRDEQADASFLRYLPTDTQGLVLNKLLDEELIIAIPSGHPLAKLSGKRDTRIPLKALSGEPFIIVGRQSKPGLHAMTVGACRAAGFEPMVSQEIPHVPSALGYVAAGLGISLTPASMRRMRLPGVSFHRISGPVQPKLPLILASRRGDPSPAGKRFVDLAKRSAKGFSMSE